MARRKCYGYTISSDGELEINPDKAKVVCWIFERCLSGDSLVENNGLMERYLYNGTPEAIISDEMFKAVQKEKQKRSSILENKFAIGMVF